MYQFNALLLTYLTLGMCVFLILIYDKISYDNNNISKHCLR